MKKRIKWIVLVVLIVGGIVAAQVLMPEPSVAAEMHRVERGALRVAVTEEGRTRVRDRYVVAAPINGRLGRIELEAGDAVEVADLVARIYSAPEAPKNVQIARAQVAAVSARRREASARQTDARGRVRFLEKEAERSRSLAASGIGTQQQVTRDEQALAEAKEQVSIAKASVRASAADIAAAKAVLDGATADDDDTAMEVHAPTGGRVLRVLEESERVVGAGTPLMEIGDASGIEVVVDVLSEDAVRIEVGDAVELSAWGGDGVIHGSVVRLEPDAFTEVSALGVEEQRVNVIVDLVDTPTPLGSGYRVEASVITWVGEDILKVPTSALLQQDGEWKVFAVDAEQRAALRTVQIGHRSAEAAEVLAGLSEGDEVIAFPSDQIAPGVLVGAPAAE